MLTFASLSVELAKTSTTLSDPHIERMIYPPSCSTRYHLWLSAPCALYRETFAPISVEAYETSIAVPIPTLLIMYVPSS